MLLKGLRYELDIDESRRARLHLHEGLDLDGAMRQWIGQRGIEAQRFQKPYRAVGDSSVRSRKHVLGCATVVYSDSLLHRRVTARIEAITSLFDLPG